MMSGVNIDKKEKPNDDNEQNLTNFKGIYFNDENVQNYFENGAHFRYRDLCAKLEKLVLTLSPGRRGKTMYDDCNYNDIKGKIIPKT